MNDLIIKIKTLQKYLNDIFNLASKPAYFIGFQ